MPEDLHKEVQFAAAGTVILDLLLWIVSLFILKFRIAVLTGLILGSIGMMCNLLLLRRSILNAVYHGKTRDFQGYLIRILIASAVIAAGLLSDYVSAPACILPFLYPKLLFGILSFRTEKNKQNT